MVANDGPRRLILNAPMGGVAGALLASALSAGDRLGMIGVGSAGSAPFLDREAEHPRTAELRFGIGLLDWAVVREPALLDAALTAAPTLISVRFGEGWSWAARVRGAGIVAATQIFEVAGARRAVDAGVELLTARGAEEIAAPWQAGWRSRLLGRPISQRRRNFRRGGPWPSGRGASGVHEPKRPAGRVRGRSIHVSRRAHFGEQSDALAAIDLGDPMMSRREGCRQGGARIGIGTRLVLPPRPAFREFVAGDGSSNLDGQS